MLTYAFDFKNLPNNVFTKKIYIHFFKKVKKIQVGLGGQNFENGVFFMCKFLQNAKLYRVFLKTCFLTKLVRKLIEF